MKVKIIDFGKNSNGNIIKGKIKLPKMLPLTADWNGNIIGTAKNFEKLKDGIYCDIKLFSDDLLKKYGNGYPCIGIATDGIIECKRDKEGNMTVTKSELMQVAVCKTTAYKDIKKLKEIAKVKKCLRLK